MYVGYGGAGAVHKSVMSLYLFLFRIGSPLTDPLLAGVMVLRYWNKDVWTGLRRILIQGQTTPETKDGLTLNMTGLLYYDPTLQVHITMTNIY